MSSYRKIKWKGIRGSTGGLFAPRSYREFFVDATNGNDANPGTSRAQAWQTIGKVNGETFRPTDHILFKRGETWVAAAVELDNASSGIAGAHITYRAYGTGADPALYMFHFIGGQSYIRVEDIDFNKNSAGSYAAQLIINNSMISNCIFRNAPVDGLLLADSDTVTITNCEAHDNGQQGIHVEPGGTSTANIIIENCTCHDNGVDTAAHHGIYVFQASNVTIRDNICYDNAGGGIKFRDVVAPVAVGPTIDANVCYGNTDGIILEALNITVINNICYGNDNGIGIEPGFDDSFIYHNTTINNAIGGIMFGANYPSNTLFENNLFVQAAANCWWPTNSAALAAAILTNSDNNNFYIDGNPATTIIGARTLAAWQGLTGGDANSIITDPVVVTEWTDFHLQVGSPCRGAGAIGTGVTEDYDGVTRGSPPDIGAYEYVA